MNVTGIIAEYNPFHNGHFYHLQKSREMTNADYVIVVMSGDFTQRGTPALIDKYARTGMALACGADLVLELPSLYATSSAEYFAKGSVSLLDTLGVVTSLCFGSECGSTAPLMETAHILRRESLHFKSLLKAGLKRGLSFPLARSAALSQCMVKAFSAPNDILGVEYCKELLRLNSPMKPCTFKREGAGYHDISLANGFSSASGIREHLSRTENPSAVRHTIPEPAFAIFQDYYKHKGPLYPDDISLLLRYKLISEQERGFASYLDVSENLSDRIGKHLFAFTSFSQFCSLLKTKEITHARISRCLNHILLAHKKTLCLPPLQQGLIPYIRLLGFRKEAAPLLSLIKKNTRAPLLSKPADARDILNSYDYSLLEADLFASHVYQSIVSEKFQTEPSHEFTRKIVIV